jgi:hypothetical protein
MQLIDSKDQTKEWRKNQKWYQNGKFSECEKIQVIKIENMTKIPLYKTGLRLNGKTLSLEVNNHPMKHDDGFDWSENFDRVQYLGEYTLLYNLKMVCGDGGAQNRTMREIYNFIRIQVDYIQHNTDLKLFFINILEGDTSYKYKKHFKSLKGEKIFIGDLKEFYTEFKILPNIRDDQ